MMVTKELLLLVLSLLTSVVIADTECAQRKYGTTRIVCVCNATYCDTIDPITVQPSGQYVWYTTTKEGLRFHKTTGRFNVSGRLFERPAHFVVNPSKTYQTIIGFGGAFTDSSGIDIESLSTQTQENLLRSYFSEDGIEYSMGRVPIAGADFSTHTYTYDDVVNDTNLTHFNLTKEDFLYKIPLIKRAQKMSRRPIKLVSAAWSAPPWMKSNDDYSGFGFLKDEYYQEWADYLVKFLDNYKKEGLEFWGISTGNEPSNGIVPINRFNSLGWTPYSQRKWVAENFGPAIRSSQHGDIKILALDDQRFMLPWWIDIMMSDQRAAQYIDGIGVHWYWDTLLPANLLDFTHDRHPDKFIISTEASVGDKPWDFVKVKLGAWERGESYMTDILQDLNHWIAGWIDWNLALDLQGGPNWAKNYVDAAIIVNTTADEFYKQPMFYALGHFTKFLPEGSIRISIEPQKQRGIETVAFITPDNAFVIVLYNEKNSRSRIMIEDPVRGVIEIILEKRSFNTIIYW
ncbi:lysosomal acid glucosylceramidase [Anabrus simplex]|uniref:lysosomal acid glucosylceramidase n=1 Tax=Anabrus simplex TaxID=316456 RepID=UPI0035A27C15